MSDELVELYKTCTTSLLQLRKDSDMSEDDEDELMETLDSLWYRMTDSQREEVDTWVREQVSERAHG